MDGTQVNEEEGERIETVRLITDTNGESHSIHYTITTITQTDQQTTVQQYSNPFPFGTGFVIIIDQ